MLTDEVYSARNPDQELGALPKLHSKICFKLRHSGRHFGWQDRAVS
jgi:hypothetical protein